MPNGNVVQLLECFPSTDTHPYMVGVLKHTCNSRPGEVAVGAQKFKVIFSCRVRSRPEWTLGVSTSKQKQEWGLKRQFCGQGHVFLEDQSSVPSTTG